MSDYVPLMHAFRGIDLHEDEASRNALSDILRDAGDEELAARVQGLEDHEAVYYHPEGVGVEGPPELTTDIVLARPDGWGRTYEARRTAQTNFEDLKERFGETRPWGRLTDEERDQWHDWLEELHEQDIRYYEMDLDIDEQDQFADAIQFAEWADLPAAYRAALDEIQNYRNATAQ